MDSLASLGPLKDPHYKEVKEPVPYTGVTSAWLDWSARFRRFVVCLIDIRIGALRDSIEQSRGRPATADDEAACETKLKLLPGFAAWKEQLHMFLDRFTAGSAGFIVAQSGVRNAHDAWRLLADAGRSLREEIMLAMLSKITNPRAAVPEKELQA